MAEAILGAALSISSTLWSWATSCVVDVCRVGPGDKVSVGFEEEKEETRFCLHLKGAAGQEPHPVPAPRHPASVWCAKRRVRHCNSCVRSRKEDLNGSESWHLGRDYPIADASRSINPFFVIEVSRRATPQNILILSIPNRAHNRCLSQMAVRSN